MKRFKGFTLVELIIVMAIMTILMAALMQMMKPIRATYVDSTYYEAQRNTQNGIVQYITESVRYATNLGVYNETETGINNINDAIAEFKASTGVTDESKMNIITINNSTAYTYNNKSDLYGRLVRSKDVAASTSRLALGDAYYGGYTYSINVEVQTTGVKVTVSSLLPTSLNDTKRSGTTVKTGDVSGYKCVSTEGMVVCQNLGAPVNGVFDTAFAGTGTTTNGKNTYLIFTLEK